MPTHTYEVPTISCGPCQAAITKSVSKVPGVTEVSVDIGARKVTVVGSSEVDAVTAAITDAGYAVASVEESLDLT